MRTSALCFLVLLTLAAVTNAQNTTSFRDNSSEQKTTRKCCRPCGRQNATDDDADVLATSIHQVLQEVMRLQEQKAQTTLRDPLHLQLQEQVDNTSAVPHSLHGRVTVKSKPSKKENVDATAEVQLLIHQLGTRLLKLETNVQKVLEHLRLQTLEKQMLESSSEPHTSPSRCISASTSPSQPTVSTLRATTTEQPMTDEEERQRMVRRVDDMMGKTYRTWWAPRNGEELCRATVLGKVEDVRRLLDSGADVNYTTYLYGLSPLISVFYNLSQNNSGLRGNPDVVTLLLERGANVNAVNRYGRTALHLAASYDKSGRGVQLLLAAGADVDARDLDGETPLYGAAWNGNELGVRALLAAGARKDLRRWGRWNTTPFDVAKRDTIRYLLRP